eukprot:6197988-Pleurochrysis_carterae.AAC.3
MAQRASKLRTRYDYGFCPRARCMDACRLRCLTLVDEKRMCLRVRSAHTQPVGCASVRMASQHGVAAHTRRMQVRRQCRTNARGAANRPSQVWQTGKRVWIAVWKAHLKLYSSLLTSSAREKYSLVQNSSVGTKLMLHGHASGPQSITLTPEVGQDVRFARIVSFAGEGGLRESEADRGSTSQLSLKHSAEFAEATPCERCVEAVLVVQSWRRETLESVPCMQS